ncbi:hypothetical protein GCM10022252_43810 [Streptosporangium oxazolinicum]|uniref:Uncharacterized protein n=1 Tax=Streptosporangium oxazolinicum TaxID=909287 RepID=A0ABP8B3J6_9ACTN
MSGQWAVAREWRPASGRWAVAREGRPASGPWAVIDERPVVVIGGEPPYPAPNCRYFRLRVKCPTPGNSRFLEGVIVTLTK